eukprot:UN28183
MICKILIGPCYVFTAATRGKRNTSFGWKTKNVNNSILIDDSTYPHLAQIDNGLWIPAWKGGKEYGLWSILFLIMKCTFYPIPIKNTLSNNCMQKQKLKNLSIFKERRHVKILSEDEKLMKIAKHGQRVIKTQITSIDSLLWAKKFVDLQETERSRL